MNQTKTSSSARISVLGAGSWGTALAHHLAVIGHEVTVWGIETEVLNAIRTRDENPKYFPGVKFQAHIGAESDLATALSGREFVVVSVPSSAYREVARKIKPHLTPNAVLVSTAKGLEADTLKTVSTVLEEELPDSSVAVLGGPSFAREVLQGLPTAVTLAARDDTTVNRGALVFHGGNFRVYMSNDVIGVELGGVVKNVLAIAVGMVEGAGLGQNARAALITRGLVEMQRLIVAHGGQANTVAGLSGLGDLVLTATGDLSRNRQVGIRLGKGEKLPDILKSLGQVAEGVGAARNTLALAKRHGLELPIVETVNTLLDGTKNLSDSMKSLLARVPVRENL